MTIESKFATKDEIFSPEFSRINQRLAAINKEHNLTDHDDINTARFPWSAKQFEAPCLYVSRMWEYPYAILAAELKAGMQCADIGCGTTPFSIYLSESTGKNCVTGFDPDEIEGSNLHSTFGANKKLLESLGIRYLRNDMTKLEVPDESFDRVFCISVLEHIEEPSVWQTGINEMVRILKPGGRLILTMDMGIGLPLTNTYDIVKQSGLPLFGGFNFRWPRERFLTLNNVPMDVFGLVLEKSDNKIFDDYEMKSQIPLYAANKNYIPTVVDSKQVQIGKDLRRPNGMLRVVMKLVTGKYSR